jgi:hypothetical protein
MEFTGIGGGIMLAIAAGLWLVYLVPNWLRRREYLATERNAVRLQQTIRVLAETAEMPAAVRAEAAARRVAQQLRVEGPVSVGRPVMRQAAPVGHDPATLARRRMRRGRMLMSAVVLASTVVAIVQLSLILTAGPVVGSWVVLVVAGFSALGSVAMLGRLAEAARSRRTSAARPARRTSLGAPASRLAEERQAEWTPVPLPKPLYLSRPAAEIAPAADPAFELALASAAAERALRQTQRQVSPLRPAAARAASPFASMGIIEDTSRSAPDLDAVLARRRAAG